MKQQLTEENCSYLSELTKQAIAKCKEQYDIDIDITPIKFDKEKSLEENKARIIQLVKVERDKLMEIQKKTKPKPKVTTTSTTSREAKKKEAEEEAKKEAEELQKLKEAEKKTIEDWKKQYNPEMVIKSPAYFEMEKYIEMVCANFSNFCIITSEGGWAKTWSSQAILKKKGVDYAYLNSFTSPLELYNFLYDNAENKIILVDDTEGIWDNKAIISIFKNATELNGKRIIGWNSSTGKLEGRARAIEFSSRIILLTNQLPNTEKNPHIEALLSRAFVSRLKFTHEQKMDIIKEVSTKKYQNLTEEQRKEVCDFIAENTSEATQELSIRTLIKCFHFYLFNQKLWKDLALRLLNVDQRKALVMKLIESGKTVKEQEAIFNKETGESRATYYRLKEVLFPERKKWIRAKQ